MTALFNTKTGIEGYLKSLSGLNNLAHDRREAYKNGYRLNEFCILGRFFLDSCGNSSLIVDNIPAEMFHVNQYSRNPARVPDVMDRSELDIFMRGESFSYSSGWPFPPHYATCSVCEKHWTIENCHDIVQSSDVDFIELDFSQFGWQLLNDIKELPDLVGKTRHFIENCQIGNRAPREGFRELPSGIFAGYVQKDYRIQPGDHALVQKMIFTHDACYRKRLASKTRADMVEIFSKAGYPNVNLITIPNEYHGGGKDGRKIPYYASPWYLAQVGDGPVFKIGWRKSVISIDWKDTEKSLPDLFADQDTTKDSFLVHAHGYDKATEYLAKLISALEN